MLNNIPCLAVSALIIFLLTALSGLSLSSVLLPVKKMVAFLIMILILNTLFHDPENCLFSAGFICISLSGIRQGANIMLHTAAIMMLSVIFIRTTTSVQIMKGIETLLRPLRMFGIPARDIALIMSIALQFIPIFFSDFDRIRKAQMARGADFSEGSLKERANALLSIVVPAFVSAFRRADELSLAIEARGYRSETEKARS